MSKHAQRGGRAPAACERCLRRAWLLAELSAPLDFLAGDQGRLIESLALDDHALIKALGGRRRAQLAAEHAGFDPAWLGSAQGAEAVCRHMRSFPPSLNSPAAPLLLNVAGGARRLEQLVAAPVIAIVGSRRATDYGLAMAKSLGRGLAASGVTVISGLCDGIAAAAHAGALEVRARTIAVAHDGLAICARGKRRELLGRVTSRGCAVCELPGDCRGRRWGSPASARIVAELAQLAVVVEAEDTGRELATARIAQALGRPLAALPGLVTSSRSTGTHALLLGGARLVRHARDVLELLHEYADQAPIELAGSDAAPELLPRLRDVLEQVGAGRDTPERLSAEGAAIDEVLLALSELELMGLLAR